VLRAVYPFLAGAHEGARFAYQLFYLLGKSPYFSPELHLAGLVVSRVSGPDLAAAARRTAAARVMRLQRARTGGGGALGRGLREGWVRMTDAVNEHTRSALILAVFGYKVRTVLFLLWPKQR
jgi:hypothetical protein